MPTSRIARSLAAGAQDPNVLDGSLYEIIRGNGEMVIAAVTDQTTNLILMTVAIDAETVLEESPIQQEPAAGQGPNLQDRILLREPVSVGDKVTIRIRNADVATRNFRLLYSVP